MSQPWVTWLWNHLCLLSDLAMCKQFTEIYKSFFNLNLKASAPLTFQPGWHDLAHQVLRTCHNFSFPPQVAAQMNIEQTGSKTIKYFSQQRHPLCTPQIYTTTTSKSPFTSKMLMVILMLLAAQKWKMSKNRPKNDRLLPLSRHEWQVKDPKQVFYLYLVPEMVWKKFHGNRMPGSANTKLPLLNLTNWVKVPSPFGCWCFHLIQNSSFANLLCCRGGLDWQMVCLFRKPQNGCGVTIFSNNKTKHLTSCCSENDTQDIKVFMAYSLPVSFSPFIK